MVRPKATSQIREAAAELFETVCTFVALIDRGSLHIDHMDRRATRDDVQRARALIQRLGWVDTDAREDGELS